jgi:hypothetical protein
MTRQGVLALGTAICVLSLAVGLTPVPAQNCVSSMLANKAQMRQNAERCRVNAELLNSIDSGDRVPARFACDRGVNVSTQLEAFEECARVYLCGMAAYTCAVQKARQGMDCTQAANSCLRDFPVPR